MKQTLKIILGSALVTAALIKGVPAFAEPAPDAVNVTIVRTADLNLRSAAGQRALDKRLVTAAHAVCNDASAVDLRAKNEEANCRAQVLSVARSRAQAIAANGSGDPIRLALAN